MSVSINLGEIVFYCGLEEIFVCVWEHPFVDSVNPIFWGLFYEVFFWFCFVFCFVFVCLFVCFLMDTSLVFIQNVLTTIFLMEYVIRIVLSRTRNEC